VGPKGGAPFYLPASLAAVELVYNAGGVPGVPAAVALAGAHLRWLSIEPATSNQKPSLNGLGQLQALTGLKLNCLNLIAVQMP
jgi:hypothetical protein